MPVRDQQIHLDVSEAPARIAAMLAQAAGGRKHPSVGITGPVGAGKSHLARALGGTLIATDDYLPDYDQTPEHLRDLPESADLDRLARDLASLRVGRATRVPQWSFFEHRRIGEREAVPTGPIVCEGLHALHGLVLGSLDVRVFVEAPAEHRWARVEGRERAGERGWSVEYLRHFFETVAEPTFERLAPAYRAAADVVVRNEGPGPWPGVRT